MPLYPAYLLLQAGRAKFNAHVAQLAPPVKPGRGEVEQCSNAALAQR